MWSKSTKTIVNDKTHVELPVWHFTSKTSLYDWSWNKWLLLNSNIAPFMFELCLCLKVVSAFFNKFLFFFKRYPFYFMQNALFVLEILKFLYLHFFLFFSVSHCFRAWSKISLKVYDLINRLSYGRKKGKRKKLWNWNFVQWWSIK